MEKLPNNPIAFLQYMIDLGRLATLRVINTYVEPVGRAQDVWGEEDE